MSDFWKSYDITAAEYGAGYECYPLFGTVHLIELALSALFLLCMVWWYRRSTLRTRRHILVGVTAALLADEAALLLGMACTGQWNWSYLPLHLCSINVFVCLYNTLTDRSWCKEELYALCIPGAALALLCPSWRDVPGWFTLINLHSVSIHALCWCSTLCCWWRADTAPACAGCRRCWPFCSARPCPSIFLTNPCTPTFTF